MNKMRHISQNKEKEQLISVIIPLYNEENSITKVIRAIPNHRKYEILIIDDGSTDNSIKKIRHLKKKNVRILCHKRNKGYGEAILTGLKNCNGNIIITMDADGQHDPNDIERLLEPLLANEADFIVGSRYFGRCQFKIPIYKKLGEIFIAFCLKLFFNIQIHNNQNGFRAFRRDFVSHLNFLKHRGMGFTTELLFVAAYKNLRVKEIPINARSRLFGTSYVKVSRILKSIFEIVIRFGIKKLIKIMQ